MENISLPPADTEKILNYFQCNEYAFYQANTSLLVIFYLFSIQ